MYNFKFDWSKTGKILFFYLSVFDVLFTTDIYNKIEFLQIKLVATTS